MVFYCGILIRGTMWVKLLQSKIISVNGTPTRFHKGDWVDIGKQSALRFIAEGSAEKPGYNLSGEYIDYTSGMLVIGSLDNSTTAQINESIPEFEIAFGTKPELLFSETLIYNSNANYIRPELIPIGFKWLDKFQLCVPLFDYKTLAIHVGNNNDRDIAKNILKELRVPLYNTHLIFARRCDETKELFTLWQEYSEQITDTNLAFLCALYQVKPVHLALPSEWIRK